MTTASVDVVLPAYNEDPVAIEATARAVFAQTHPVAHVFLVDDCSAVPVSLPDDIKGRIALGRTPTNSGISAARNLGISQSRSTYIACINIEVIPRSDWVDACCRYLQQDPAIGVVATRTVPADVTSIATRWRMRCQELPPPVASGPIDWGAGHALMFRAAALRAVGGFDASMRKAHEDVDICRRLREAGWGVHFLSDTVCTSIQVDTLATLAKSEFNRFSWRADSGNGLVRCVFIATNRAVQRSLSHLVFLRWSFLPVEVGLWLLGVRLAWRHR